MKIVFFGSSEFAVPALNMLLSSSHEVLAVVTQPDREKGRSLLVQGTPVKKAVSSKPVKIYQSEDLRNPASMEFLAKLQADLFVVVAFGQILTTDVLEMPELCSINLHPSLLPKYRGAAPVNWAVINGENKTGLSVIRMNERMDAGDIIMQRAVKIEPEDTAETLSHRLAELGGVLLLDAVRFISENKAKFKRQDEKKVTFAPRLKKEDGLVNWKKTALEIHNLVRGAVPWPGAYTICNNKKINAWKTSIISGSASPGEVVEARRALIVGTGKGLIELNEVQLEGKKRMSALDFLRGFRDLEKGKVLGS